MIPVRSGGQREPLAAFRYRLGPIGFVYFLATATILIFTAALIFTTFDLLSRPIQPLALWFCFVWACAIAGGMWLGWWTFLVSRPINVTSDGIENCRTNGTTWNQINWSELEKAERRRIYDPLNNRFASLYVLSAHDRTIRFDSTIIGLPKLLADINTHIARNQIQIVFSDRTGPGRIPRSVGCLEFSVDELDPKSGD